MRHCHPSAGPDRNGSSRRRSLRAFTMIEVIFSLFIFVLMAIMVSAALAAATMGSRTGNTYAQAMSVAQRKLDQLQEEGYSTLVGTDFANVGTSNIVDSNTWTSHGWSSSGAGSGYVEATFKSSTTGDHLTDFFPSNVNGKIDVYPYGQGSSMTMLRAVVTISWTEANGQQSSYSISSIVSSNVDTTF